MGEISKVILRPDLPLGEVETDDLLTNLKKQAVKGFRVAVGEAVIAYASGGGSASFTVARIEPTTKFYGAVDKDTEFEIFEDKPPPPSVECIPSIKDPYALENVLKSVDELFPTEAERFKLFVNDLEAVKAKHNVSWDCVRKVVEAISEYSRETAPQV